MKTAAALSLAAAIASTATAGSADPWAPPAGYYDGVAGEGAALKATLYSAMSAGHVQRRYGDFRQSAAIHDQDPSDASNIILVYLNQSIPGGWTSGSTWNREHVWPQSRQPGDASNSTRGNLGDPHALKPCNPGINGSRGNKPFGFADTFGMFGSQGSYYFPGDQDKGDIARSLFYSDTRWGPERGISLVRGFPSGNQMGDLTALIAWHYLDIPDQFERRRNHAIFSSTLNPSYFTNNRNAYIDNPGLVWSVYEDAPNDAQLFVGFGPTTSGESSIILEATPIFTGMTLPETTFTLERDGDDGVYFRAIPTEGSTVSTDLGAFAIDGDDAQQLTLGFEQTTANAPGAYSASLLIDNLDVTTGAGDGRGALDGDDAVFLDVRVLDRAEASFDEGSDTDTLLIELGQTTRGAATPGAEIDIFNIGGEGQFVAGLDLELDTVAGDADRFETDLVSATGVFPIDELNAVYTMNTDRVGDFQATFIYRTFDDRDIPGFQEGDPIAVTVTGSITLGPCGADLTGDNAVTSEDLGALLAAWASPDAAADLNGDGAVDSGDLGILLAAWGPCP